MKNLNIRTKICAVVCAMFVGTILSASALADDNKYDAAKSQAKATYDEDKAHCDALAGDAKDICVKDAKAKLASSEADAKAQSKTRNAQHEAATDKNAANYKAAKERCEVYSGDKKDACIDTAKTKYKQ